MFTSLFSWHGTDRTRSIRCFKKGNKMLVTQVILQRVERVRLANPMPQK